jgi:hypothetical protein
MMPIASFSGLLESPAWAVISTVTAVVAFLAWAVLARKQRQRKRLSYLVAITELVSVHGDAEDKIEIIYDGDSVERVHLIEVTLENVGNVAIPAADYEAPFSVGLGEGAEVLTMEVVRTQPAGMRAKLDFSKGSGTQDPDRHTEASIEDADSKVTLQPLLLNPEDQLTIKILVADFAGEPDLEHRIIGLTQLTNSVDSKESKWRRRWDSGVWLVWILFFLFLVCAYAIGHNAGEPDHHKSAIHLLGGKTRCGTVLKATDQHLVLQADKTGVISTVPIDQVISIKDDKC